VVTGLAHEEDMYAVDADRHRAETRALGELRERIAAMQNLEEVRETHARVSERLAECLRGWAQFRTAPIVDLDPTGLPDELLQASLDATAAAWEWRAAVLRETAELVRAKHELEARLAVLGDPL
jgi:microcystin degradation protein MlrC